MFEVTMKFKHGDKVAFYKPLGRYKGFVKCAPYMPYIVVEDKEGKEHRVHPKQCRLLKEKTFKVGDEVTILPSRSEWYVNHIDVYFIKPNVIPEQHLEELAEHCLNVLNKTKLTGIVIGFGMDDSIKVEFDYTGKKALIEKEHLRMEK